MIDSDPNSPTYHEVIATVQELDADGATLFDEPVGVAFANSDKAYVALSSRNDIAVIDVATRSVSKRVHITAQEPRAIAVANGRLYVAAFESGNQTELSACPDPDEVQGAPQCTLDASDLSDFVVSSPNIPGSDPRIVVDSDVPDRDLFVFDTSDESGVDVVSGIGTLLYGLAVDGDDHVFVTQTEARNAENPTNGEDLIELDNRMFLNQIAEVNCNGGSCSFAAGTDRVDLEPLPPIHPAEGDQLATPYGIAVSGDDATIVATAAASSRIFSFDPDAGNVLDRLDVGDIPRGVALYSNAGTGAAETAYVLNSLGHSVSVVDVSNPNDLELVKTVDVGNDPTPEAVRLGRVAFNDADASSTGTFACAGCHPDGHTDQLLWRIGGACDPNELDPACGHDEVRSTMPVRGLDNTLPLHWDGTLGDPVGGGNGAVGAGGPGGSDCVLGDADGPQDCFLDLVKASLSGVMCDQSGSCPPGGNELSEVEQDHMASFLWAVLYPPARSRRIDDSVSASALAGFSDFFVDKPQGALNGDAGDFVGVTTCADMNSGCHAPPLGADDNSSTLAGFDAPTMRGMTDRFLHFSIGITTTEESLLFAQEAGQIPIDIGFGPIPLDFPASPIPWDPNEGLEEDASFAAAFAVFDPAYAVGPIDLFQMFEEASTGTSGATGRQLTLSVATTTGSAGTATYALLDDLQDADTRGAINLRGDGVHEGTPVTVSYEGAGVYQVGPLELTRAQLEDAAENGDLLATLTGRLPTNVGSDPQPLLAPNTTGDGATGNPDLPVLPGDNPMTLAGIDVVGNPAILVDGQVVSGSVACVDGDFEPTCTSGEVQITLDATPSGNHLHLLQVRNPGGLASTELPFCVGAVSNCD